MTGQKSKDVTLRSTGGSSRLDSTMIVKTTSVKEHDMSTPAETLPNPVELPLEEYSDYRELALGVLSSIRPSQGFPNYFAPKPMSGSVSSSVA